jgi:hypothetical protein
VEIITVAAYTGGRVDLKTVTWGRHSSGGGVSLVSGGGLRRGMAIGAGDISILMGGVGKISHVITMARAA